MQVIKLAINREDIYTNLLKIMNKIIYHEIILKGVEDSPTSLYAANALSRQLANHGYMFK